MSLFIDTSVWSLALRRDAPLASASVRAVTQALETGETIVTTGLVLQELLQGFSGPKDRKAILDRFESLPFLTPDRNDHVEAADLRNQCRRRGVQVETIDALFAQLCIRHDLTMLTTDDDFRLIARLGPLKLWMEPR